MNFITNEIPFYATDPNETNVNDLDYLPKISSLLLKQVVEPSVIWISLSLLINTQPICPFTQRFREERGSLLFLFTFKQNTIKD